MPPFHKPRQSELTLRPPATEEQTEILRHAAQTESNLMFNALAGTGKTNTLERVEDVVKQSSILYLVFNKRNADEASTRMASTTAVSTFNSLGHRAWAGVVGRRLEVIDVGGKSKTYLIFKEIADQTDGDERSEVWECYEQVTSGVAMAKALGYVPEDVSQASRRLISTDDFFQSLDEEPDELTAGLINAVLKRSIKMAYQGQIDFNDQVYMSALFGASFNKPPLTLVDEYQDLNPVNHEIIRRLVGKDRRLFGVGDPNQNIYGFRGAARDGMYTASKRFDMVNLNLSVSFRCPEAIVKNAWWHVPHFKWFKTGGEVGSRDGLFIGDLEPNATFICRNNAPLFALAFKLIANGIGVNLLGSDIGPRLITTLKKLGDTDCPTAGALRAVDDWLQAKLKRQSKSAPDMAECMRIIINQGTDLGQAIHYAEYLFKQRGAIQLMTGHKSKGLEFPLVYHLNPYLIGEGQQDRNIRYVIQTRSSDRYFEIDSETIQWKV